MKKYLILLILLSFIACRNHSNNIYYNLKESEVTRTSTPENNSIEGEINKVWREFIKKQYYAVIIDQNHPYFQVNEYQVLLTSDISMDANCDWIVINRFGLAQDKEDVRYWFNDTNYWATSSELKQIRWKWAE